MSDLLERLEKATVPDRELDLCLAKVFGEEGDGFWRHVAFNLWLSDYVPGTPDHYTSSTDAALALAERVLPGWTWSLNRVEAEFLQDGERPFFVDLTGPITWVDDSTTGSEPEYESESAKAATLPLAICIAVVRAHEASQAFHISRKGQG